MEGARAAGCEGRGGARAARQEDDGDEEVQNLTTYVVARKFKEVEDAYSKVKAMARNVMLHIWGIQKQSKS